MNRLHIATRESVIRKLLLFREGEPYVPSRLEETERLLRGQKFLRAASVVAGHPRDGIVDVVVTTYDSWSTQPGGQAGSAGGETDYGFAIEETNLLGLGKHLTLFYDSGVDRTGYGVRYEDPALAGPRWRANALIMNNSDGQQFELGVERPFYSFAATWGGALSISQRQFTSRVYEGGVPSSAFDQTHRHLGLRWGRALRPHDSTANRLSAGIDFQTDEFRLLGGSPLEQVLPDDRDYRYVFLEYEYAENRFRKVNFVNLDERYEDLRTGAQFRMRAGVSPSLLGADTTTWKVDMQLSRGFAAGSSTVLASISHETRFGSTQSNAVTGVDLQLIRPVAATRPQTTIARLSARAGDDLDPDRQFFADGSMGLRGYRLHSYAGDSLVIVNLEHRIYLGRELGKVVSPGLAVFVDAGNAGDREMVFDPRNLKLDAGVGLRLGLTRTTRRVFRLDFAYAFDQDPLGRSGWLVSFSGGQAF